MTEKQNYEIPSDESTSNVYNFATDDVVEESRNVNLEFSQPNRTKMQRAKPAKTTTPISSPKPKSQKDNLSLKRTLIVVTFAVIANLVIASVGLWMAVQVKDEVKNNNETQAKELTRLENLQDALNQRQDIINESMDTSFSDTQQQVESISMSVDGHRQLLAGLFSSMISVRYQIDSYTGTFRIRLVEGDDQKSGRVEIFHDGRWGTICDDIKDIDAGNLMCRMLGFTRATFVYGGAYHGEGSGTIWLDDLECNKNETSLDDCVHSGWGVHDCEHTEDLSLICQ